MKVVLGIDAAWTNHNPSGVALVVQRSGGDWHCLAVAPSYDEYMNQAKGGESYKIDWGTRHNGSAPNITALLQATASLLTRNNIQSQNPDIIAVDMPLWNKSGLIQSRRPSDNSISKAFGGRGAAAHSPTKNRPGALSGIFFKGLKEHGYTLAVAQNAQFDSRHHLVEVYPHPALLTLLCRDYRIAYKSQNSTKYWPVLQIPDRISKLLDIYRDINTALGSVLVDTGLQLPANVSTLAALKPYEDALDALICAWVGICCLEGRAMAYGDSQSAIWVP